jgi:hypothetical protein
VLGLKENNGLALKDDYIVKIEQDFVDSNVEYSVGRLQHYYDKFIKNNGGKHYISIIPDKNYFLGKDSGYPAPDYAGLSDRVTAALPSMEYIDIYDKLDLDDYYRTDTHWSQDKIGAVAEKIATALGVADRLSGSYKTNALENFYGVYAGQIALDVKPDTLYYLTNDVLDACTVYDYETGKKGKIYDLAKFESTDGYDVFLSGTRALLRIDNPNATTDEELVIFRDSFGSSLTPLLAEGYKSIYIVDIRYVAPSLLSRFKIPFETADVLFMYSTLILDSSFGFKGWNG